MEELSFSLYYGFFFYYAFLYLHFSFPVLYMSRASCSRFFNKLSPFVKNHTIRIREIIIYVIEQLVGYSI
ncbi:hypothetical protein Hanom_Chr17g01587681 [Helianthus anomalus]